MEENKKVILIIGSAPFGGDLTNPTYEVAKLLNGTTYKDYVFRSAKFLPSRRGCIPGVNAAIEEHNPAIIIAATQGEGITAAADGQVTSVYEDPEIGMAVVVNLGDGYELTYGQLTDLTVAEGDVVTTGEIIGKVAEPTKYYSVEGCNVYFKLTKDGQPVNPLNRLS